MRCMAYLPLLWLGPEEGLHKDLALQGKHIDPVYADAGLQVLATLNPWRGRRPGPCGRVGWVSPLHRAGSRERRMRCFSDSWVAAEGARGSWGLPGCKRAWERVGTSRCLGQAPCRVGAVHNLPPSYSSSSSHC